MLYSESIQLKNTSGILANTGFRTNAGLKLLGVTLTDNNLHISDANINYGKLRPGMENLRKFAIIHKNFVEAGSPVLKSAVIAQDISPVDPAATGHKSEWVINLDKFNSVVQPVDGFVKIVHTEEKETGVNILDRWVFSNVVPIVGGENSAVQARVDTDLMYADGWYSVAIVVVPTKAFALTDTSINSGELNLVYNETTELLEFLNGAAFKIEDIFNVLKNLDNDMSPADLEIYLANYDRTGYFLESQMLVQLGVDELMLHIAMSETTNSKTGHTKESLLLDWQRLSSKRFAANHKFDKGCFLDSLFIMDSLREDTLRLKLNVW